jgi:parvulin-like peptidyl-prolyl isomerase
MSAVLEVGDRTITAEEIIPLLANYQMLPQLMRESIIDREIAPFACTPEETTRACQQFFERNQLDLGIEQQAWMQRYGLNLDQLVSMATRRLRIEKFKQATWGSKLETYFLKRKRQLDKVVYSLLITKERSLATELFFRIQEQEQSFSELAREYSQGIEAETGGIIGPVELGGVNLNLAQMLAVSQPGQLWSPVKIGEWQVIVRLEKLIPARLDAAMRQQLLDELFKSWLSEQMRQLPHFN